MSHDQSEKLVRMANQIGKFFASQREEIRVPGIAEHIQKFWEPRMRNQIFAHLDAGGPHRPGGAFPCRLTSSS